MLLGVVFSWALVAAPVKVGAVPPAVRTQLALSEQYTKSVDANGFAIVGSERVADAAMREARLIVTSMLVNHPEYFKTMAAAKIRLAVMAPSELTTDIPEHSDLTPKDYWNRRARGLGATVERPAVSCAEENLLGEPGDPYSTENICVHEFAHTVASFALTGHVPGFPRRLQAAFEQATKTEAWKNTYAATNEQEYWAEAVQSWFDTNRHDDAEHGTIDTREEVVAADPMVAALITEVFGEVKWRYRKPAARSKAELAKLGLLPSPLPVFTWPGTLAPLIRPGDGGTN